MMICIVLQVLVMCCDMIFPPKYGVQRPVSPRPPVDRPDANNQQDGDGIRVRVFFKFVDICYYYVDYKLLSK